MSNDCYDYGYGELGNKLVELFHSGPPDFDAAEELIRQGADVNTIGKNDSKNILSNILSGYRWPESRGTTDAARDDGEDSYCDGSGYGLNPRIGAAMCAIIRFFLAHGFDVNKRDGCFGAQCLYALTLSTHDRYIIEATKLLLDAGARNRSVSPASTSDSTPWGFMALESSYLGTCERNHATANIFEAVYRIYQAIEDGKPYGGIDSYEIAIGKKVQKVLAERNGDKPIFYSMDLPGFKKENCFNQTLYFVYEGGVMVTTQYADFWTDTVLPETDLVDVSEHFKGIVGNTIRRFAYGHRSVVKDATRYGQPITTLEMDLGYKVRFSINFGEVEQEKRAAFYELLE